MHGESAVASDTDVSLRRHDRSHGGVVEFDGDTDRVQRLQWHGRCARVAFHLDLTGRRQCRSRSTARDLDVSIDDAIQQIAVQYRVGAAGAYTNLPAGYIADATTVSTATQTTTRTSRLPAAVDDQASVFVGS